MLSVTDQKSITKLDPNNQLTSFRLFVASPLKFTLNIVLFATKRKKILFWLFLNWNKSQRNMLIVYIVSFTTTELTKPLQASVFRLLRNRSEHRNISVFIPPFSELAKTNTFKNRVLEVGYTKLRSDLLWRRWRRGFLKTKWIQPS